MKTKHFILLFAFLGMLLTVNVHARKEVSQKTPNNFITINPFGCDSTIKSINYGDRIKFEILNVNTFKVNGYTTSKSVNFDSEVPAIFTDFAKSKTNTKDTTMSNSSSNKNQNAFVSPPTSQVKTNPLVQKQDEFKQYFNSLIELYQEINSYTSLEDNLYKELSDSIFIRNTRVLKENCESQYQAYYGSLDSSFEAKKIVLNVLNRIDTTFSGLKLRYEELSTMQKDQVITMNGKLQSSDNKNTISITNAQVKLEVQKYFESEFTYAKKVYDQISDSKNKTIIINKSHAGIDLYNKIKNESFTVYTDSQPANADEVTFTPVLKNAEGKVVKEFTSFQVRTKGRLKVNFSTGYLLSFIGDDNYSLYKGTDGTITGISKGNKNSLTHALGALAHVYRSSEYNFNFALSSGISLANNSSVGFYLGGSLLFLEKNRVAITAGISYIQIQKLNTANLLQASSQDIYTFRSSTDNEIKYDKVYKPGVFISITYNLSENK